MSSLSKAWVLPRCLEPSAVVDWSLAELPLVSVSARETDPAPATALDEQETGERERMEQEAARREEVRAEAFEEGRAAGFAA